MTDILGHDVDGRPLRVGDEVVVVAAGSKWARTIGMKATVTGGPDHDNCDIEITLDGGVCGDTHARWLRKLDNHQPAGSFDEVMAGLKQPQGVAQ